MTRWSLLIAATWLVVGCRCERHFGDVAAALPRTTAGKIAVGNLAAMAESRQKSFASSRAMQDGLGLIEVYLARAQFLGAYLDFERAQAVIEALMVAHPGEQRVILARARLKQAVHDWRGALSDLNLIDPHGQSLAANEMRDNIAMAQGGDLSRIERRRKARADRSDFQNLVAWADVQAELGRYQEADELHERALRSYDDVSPFPVASVLFQRGVMWSESAGKPQRAWRFYEEATQRLPQYVAAQVHFAELEADQGRLPSALRRLQDIAQHTDDPEPLAVLAELHPDATLRAAYAQRAREGYEHWLAKYPLAFLDHAAEFFLAAGSDPQKAFELAMKNLRSRHTPRAYLLAMRAADAAGHASTLCALIDQAEAWLPRHAVLAEFVAEQNRLCSGASL